MGGIERLWAPWRSEYIKRIDKERERCFLCEAAKSNSPEDALLVYRGERTIVVLNKYPYNPGHLLVAPVRHVASIEDLSREERCELIEVVAKAKVVLDKIYHPNGFNIGLNLGRVAGAGLEGHLHIHVVPRWAGDTSFTVTISGVKVIVEALEQSYREIREAFSRI